MKIATFNGGMSGQGKDEIIKCCLCGDQNYDNIYVARVGIAIGMSGDDYSFCKKCWLGKNFGKRLLQFLNYPNGMYLKETIVTITDIDDEK